MSWAVDRAAIKSAIEGLSGYIIIPENKEPENAPGSHTNKAYSIRLQGSEDSTMFTGSAIIYVHSVEVLVRYLVVDDTIRATNESLFLTLQNTLSALASFINFNSEPSLEVIDNKYLVGTLDFQYGVGTNT